MQLRDATRAILDSEAPANWIKLADMYINSFNKMQDAFVLPAKHAVLESVINSFYDNDEAFAEYIRAIRDQFPKSTQRDDLHQVYRTINGRVVQQIRRARMARALSAIERTVGRKLEPAERDRVAVRLEQSWGRRRLEHLKNARASTDAGRVSSDERSELVTEFWQMIDDEITRSEFPMFKF